MTTQPHTAVNNYPVGRTLTNKARRTFRWMRSITVIILVALVTSQFSLVRAIPLADAATVSFSISVAPGTSPDLCVGATRKFYANVIRNTDRYINDGKFLLSKSDRLANVDVKAEVADPKVGTISPAHKETSFKEEAGPQALFTFKATKAGKTKVVFNADVNAFYTGPHSEIEQVEKIYHVNKQSVDITVKQCKFKVSVNSKWSIPGEANLSYVAEVNEAEVTGDEQGHFTGSAKVNWTSNAGGVENCSGTSTVEPSPVNITGDMNESDELKLTFTFQSAQNTIAAKCDGESGTTKIGLTADPLKLAVSADGGASSQSQALRGPGTVSGSAFIDIVPDDEQGVAFNQDSALHKRIVAQATPEATPAAASTPIQANLVFGPGAFNLTDPAAGLADLSGYKANLNIAFDGTQSGKADKWSRTHVLLTARESAARQLTIQNAGEPAAASFRAVSEGVAYERIAQNACTATALDKDNSFAAQMEPARLLTGVIGAEAAGEETINGVLATHYTFDERALGLPSIAKATGEMWVAVEGGYIVKYIQTTKAGADYFGDGSEGVLTVSYELTDANKPAALNLPADCPAGMVNATVMPNATSVRNRPASLSFKTVSSLADASVFYQKNLADLGWKPLGAPTKGDTLLWQDFTQGDQQMSLIISANNGVTTVRLLLMRVVNTKPAAPTKAPTRTPVPTKIPAPTRTPVPTKTVPPTRTPVPTKTAKP